MAEYPTDDLLDGIIHIHTKTQLKNRIVVIDEVSDFSVNSAEEKKVFGVTGNQLDDFSYIWVGIVPPGGGKPFELKVQWMHESGTGYTERDVFYSGSSRGLSDWIEVKALRADFYVKNNSGALAYNRITLFGVR